MTVKELRVLAEYTRIIARDGKDDKILFDTKNNRKEYVDKYNNAKISHIWTSVIDCNNGFAETAIVMYLHHNSWLISEVTENDG